MKRFSVGVALTCLLLAGCGDQYVTSPPRVGPIGSAVDSIECQGTVYRKGAGDYVDGGLERVKDTPEAAWADLVDQDDPGVVPHVLHQVLGNGERVLLTFDNDGRAVATAVAVDGTEDWDGGTGWGIESWAVCDPSELPAKVTAGWWIQVWRDQSGHRVPTTDVYSYDGPEHCDWQAMTFLQVGDQQYLRDPDGELADYTLGRFQTSAMLPDDATGTGWRHEGRELWTAPGRGPAYLVAVGDPNDVEAWPRAQELGCA